ncbi:hypothetical protein Sgleb_73690 [Streptomyces glebosus]|uniref:Ricin B lectin domain-containing protein n=1 Tax=Streptomyces glebosus TaxID=249580 RepID=A0A640T8J2_9ACTN|nr:hypothetical protein Sgleb_73690 [Streptomyces glebosus]GHG62313.1 hypothetical protein GCM10010513_28910 [Streptomyces glebosus]
MRTRIWLTGVAMGAAILTGATATAQAAPAHPETATGSSRAMGWVYAGTYLSQSACRADGENSAQEWKCVPASSGKWHLYVRS